MKLFKRDSGSKPVFPNIIEKFFGRKINDGFSKNEEVSTVPSVNISDEEKVFDVRLAVPGLEKKDIKIEIENNCLVISSEKEYEKKDKDKNWIRREYGYASFQRIFQLPENADSEKINAQLKNGILSISIGKDAKYDANTKRIEVK